LTLLVVVAIPYGLWQAALWITLGQPGVIGTDHPPLLPLGGLSGARDVRQGVYDLATVVIPTLLCLGLLGLGWRRAWRVARNLSPPAAQHDTGMPAAATAQGASHLPRLVGVTVPLLGAA